MKLALMLPILSLSMNCFPSHVGSRQLRVDLIRTADDRPYFHIYNERNIYIGEIILINKETNNGIWRIRFNRSEQLNGKIKVGTNLKGEKVISDSLQKGKNYKLKLQAYPSDFYTEFEFVY